MTREIDEHASSRLIDCFVVQQTSEFVARRERPVAQSSVIPLAQSLDERAH